MSTGIKAALCALGAVVIIVVFIALQRNRDAEEEERELRNAAAKPALSGTSAPVLSATGRAGRTANLADVRVSFTHRRPDGTSNTLLVHADGSVDRTSGGRDAPVTGRLLPGSADDAKLARVFDSAAWRSLPDNASAIDAMYTIEQNGRSVKRSDPLGSIEAPFVDALGVLGELDMKAQRSPP